VRHTLISADSHITEPPNLYRDYIDPAYRDQAPYIQRDEKRGDMYVLGAELPPIPVGIIAAAGKNPMEIRADGVVFDDMHPGGWDGQARLRDQDIDGVSAEVIYPTIGMMLCNHPDFALKRACFKAYNRWLVEFCSADPNRLLGAGQIAMHDPQEAIADLEEIARQGLRGVMLPGHPAVEDYDHPCYDDFYRAALELGLPLSFHILTAKAGAYRGSALNGFMTTIRGNQDIMGMLVFGGVFDRHPDLKVVCVEADAGWVPHYMYRMDHGYLRHRHWITPGKELQRRPSEYFGENIYTTFQDDWSAFGAANAGMLNDQRLMWANDFPHSDSTWPWSQPLLSQHVAALEQTTRERILYRNVAQLYRIDLSQLTLDKADLSGAQGDEVEGYNAVSFKHAGTMADLPGQAAANFMPVE
jgi:predicted TIM-barrel fold metal-dependent hydrolase